jgi:predicted alpha/beta-fold hydrolase
MIAFHEQIAGHVWTAAPALRGFVRPPRDREARPFTAVARDPVHGAVRLAGLLREAPRADTLVVIVHGLSGSAEDPYCHAGAMAALEAGCSSLRLSLRGADGSGEDFYHGGLTADLGAALQSPLLARYRRVLLLGYSVGGHIALSAAVERIDPRLYAVAAICAPLDLGAAAANFDAPSLRFYRKVIVGRLDANYAAVAARRPVPTPPERVRRARTCAERDELTVVPRFGFASAADYYARASVASRLPDLVVPSLLVLNRHDPIIPPHTLRAALAGAPRALTVQWVERGGHVFFPGDLDLGQPGSRGLERQVIRWLGRQ